MAGKADREARCGARFGDGSDLPEMVGDDRFGLVGSDRAAVEAPMAAFELGSAAVVL